MPPHKKPRFAVIGGGRDRGRGRYQHNRPFRGYSGRGRNAGIDAYYNPSMFEDPWKELISALEKEEEIAVKEVGGGNQDSSDEQERVEDGVLQSGDAGRNESEVSTTSDRLTSDSDLNAVT